MVVDEFVFWHAVGCSRQSMNVNNLLRRLLTDLKNRFELLRDVPKSHKRLSWELPRFLELAAKKGKVLVVIDGLNRLLNNEGQEDALAWLPINYPANVRFILTVTVKQDDKQSKKDDKNKKKDDDDDDAKENEKKKNKKSRILTELDRRKIPFILLKPLGRSICRSVVENYMQKSVRNEHSTRATGRHQGKRERR